MIRQTEHDSTRSHRIERAIALHLKPAKRLFIGGFTLLELLIIVVISSVLFAIMAPGWAAFMNGQRLNGAQDSVLQAMRDAQSHAKRSHIIWQASFQDANGVVQWAVHPANTTPTVSAWNNLDSAIQMDAETTLQPSSSIRKVQFDHEGNVNGLLGRLTLSSKNGGKVKRCVIVSTLLGVVRTGSEQSTMQGGKYCY